MIDAEILKEKTFRKNLYNLMDSIVEHTIYTFENNNETVAASYVVESFLNRNYRLFNLRKSYGNMDKILRHKLRKHNKEVYNRFMKCYSKMNIILNHFYNNSFFCPKNYKELDNLELFRKYFEPYATGILEWFIADNFTYENGEDNWKSYLDSNKLED